MKKLLAFLYSIIFSDEEDEHAMDCNLGNQMLGSNSPLHLFLKLKKVPKISEEEREANWNTFMDNG